MRGLYSIHDIANAPMHIWDHPGYVSLLICTQLDREYMDVIRKNWALMDAASGSSLWVAVSFLPDNDDNADAEARASIENIRHAGLALNDTPCLLFAQSPDSQNYFRFPLRGVATEEEAGKEFFRVFDACQKHFPSVAHERTEENFIHLQQELRVISHEPLVRAAAGLTGKVLMELIKKTATAWL